MKNAAIISGASSGIGEATARLFAQNGYYVVLLGRNVKRLEKLQSEIKNSEYHAFDLSHRGDSEKAFEKIKKNTPYPITVLVNNAGIYKESSFAKTKDSDWDLFFQNNLMSTVRLTRAFVPMMIKNQEGSVINVSSTLGLKPVADTSIYSCFKAAMNNLTQCLALEYGGQGIRFNAVCPGLVDTPIHDFHKLKGKEKEKVLKSLAPIQPLGRVGTPEEIAKAIYFLASGNSSWTTGALLSVDGGIGIK